MFISSEADPLSRCWLMPKGTPHKTQTSVPRCDEGSQLPDHRVRAWGLSRELEKFANHEILDGQRISLFSRKVAQEAVRLFHLKRGQIMDANRTHNRATKATGAMICGPLEFPYIHVPLTRLSISVPIINQRIRSETRAKSRSSELDAAGISVLPLTCLL